MTPKEANRIIAEFMGFEWDGFPDGDIGIVTASQVCQKTYSMNLFTTDLNALAPVWEKLGYSAAASAISRMKMFLFKPQALQAIGENTIQEAAAIATAKAIQEFEK